MIDGTTTNYLLGNEMTKFKKGDRVRALVVIQSDDRSGGIDDGTPIVRIGMLGTVLGHSEEFAESDITLKEPNCYVVRWDNTSAYDVADYEMELVA